MDKIEKMEGLGDGEGEDSGVLDKMNPLKAREKYRQERINKIKEMRSNNEMMSGTTYEELKSKPSYKEVKMRPLV